MKIAFLVGTFPKLSETFVLNQITGLIDRGHQVDIFADAPGNESVVHEDFNKYGLSSRTFYFSYGTGNLAMPRSRLLRVLKSVGLLAGNFHKRPGCLLKSLNVFKYGKEAISLGLLYKAVAFLNKASYDIIFCHFGANGIVGAMLKDVGAVDGRLITAFHGADMSRSVKENGDDLYKHLFLKGDLFLPISDRWKKELVRLGCEEQRIIVHRMGIDTGRFTFTPRKRREGGRINILTVGRLVEKKGIKYGICAVARIIEHCPGVEYTIIGDGPLKGDIQKLIAALHVDDNIKLLGWRSQEEIIGLMESADILLAPSVTAKDGDQEGIPVVIMEAMAQGMPVLSTVHSGIPELVRDGESGFLVGEGETDSLAEKLLCLAEHPYLWSRMGEAGRSHVEENFNIDRLNDRLEKICENLLSGGTPAIELATDSL